MMKKKLYRRILFICTVAAAMIPLSCETETDDPGEGPIPNNSGNTNVRIADQPPLYSSANGWNTIFSITNMDTFNYPVIMDAAMFHGELNNDVYLTIQDHPIMLSYYNLFTLRINDDGIREVLPSMDPAAQQKGNAKEFFFFNRSALGVGILDIAKYETDGTLNELWASENGFETYEGFNQFISTEKYFRLHAAPSVFVNEQHDAGASAFFSTYYCHEMPLVAYYRQAGASSFTYYATGRILDKLPASGFTWSYNPQYYGSSMILPAGQQPLFLAAAIRMTGNASFPVIEALQGTTDFIPTPQQYLGYEVNLPNVRKIVKTDSMQISMMPSPDLSTLTFTDHSTYAFMLMHDPQGQSMALYKLDLQTKKISEVYASVPYPPLAGLDHIRHIQVDGNGHIYIEAVAFDPSCLISFVYKYDGAYTDISPVAANGICTQVHDMRIFNQKLYLVAGKFGHQFDPGGYTSSVICRSL